MTPFYILYVSLHVYTHILAQQNSLEKTTDKVTCMRIDMTVQVAEYLKGNRFLCYLKACSLSFACFIPYTDDCFPPDAVSSQTGHGLSSRQMKEATFLQEVRQAAAEERANQLRW